MAKNRKTSGRFLVSSDGKTGHAVFRIAFVILEGRLMKNQRHHDWIPAFLLIFCLGMAVSMCQAESAGDNDAAAVTGNYRNLFKEIGKNDAEIANKIDMAWNQLFYGDDNNQRVYYEAGSDMAYIKDIGNDDIRTEGMSYGMMICVQMDKKAEFDKLWKWAKTNMYYSSGQYKGYFAWHCKDNGTKIGGNPTPASDGEEYFATALIFAAKRWGNGGGICDYATEAQNLLSAMLHQSDDGEGTNMFDRKQNQVVFCPMNDDNSSFTDPSYHVPAFYEVWAGFTQSPTDKERWLKIAETSRKFFAKTVHPTTGLCPDYANWSGSPRIQGDNHQNFYYDAWRTIANASVDYAWWRKDDFEPVYADRIQAFFEKKGSGYGNLWTLSGSKLGSDHSPGLVAMNAVASLAATDKAVREKFVRELWAANIPQGKWRYYDGILTMLALLHCSGNFKAYY